MGYYFQFDIKLKEANSEDTLIFQTALKEIYNDFEFDSKYNTAFIEAKWYDYDEDLLSISKLIPDCYIVLYREGEESNDLYKSVYCNGKEKTVQAEIIYPKINVQSIGGIGERKPELFI